MDKIWGAAVLTVAVLGSGAGAGGAGAPGVGGAQVQPATAVAVASTLRAAGYRVSANPTPPGEAPSFSVQTPAGERVDVWFSLCRAQRCDRVTASLSWEVTGAPDLKRLNAWNSDAYTQAYVYDALYHLDSSLILRGGYTRAALLRWMEVLLEEGEDFAAELD